MSQQHARHRKPSRRQAAKARHRRRSPAATALRRGPIVTVLVAGTTLAAGGAATAFAVSAGPGGAPATADGHRQHARLDRSRAPARPTRQPDGTASQAPAPAAPRSPARRKPAAKPRPTPSRTSTPPPPVYRNPVRAVTGLIPERVDMGVDFGGNGPIYALGDAVITNATGDSAGWPGGGWITYQLTSGPAKGLQVYFAEDVQPTVQAGQHVTASTVIGNMVNRGDGVETGWARPDGASAESQLAVAGGISGGGPFPTQVGLDFDRLLVALGAPAAPNATSAGNGTLPAGYPVDWASLLG